MNRDDLKKFEGLFIELKKNILTEMKMKEVELEWQKGDEADQEGTERSHSLQVKLLGRQNFMLKKIDHCLLKIKNGTYGQCEECEGDIEISRLKARPVATQCIACKEAEERNEDKMLYEKRSHTHGKTMFNNVILMNSYKEIDNIVSLNSENF